MRENRVKSTLEAGGRVIGTMVVEMRSPAVAMLMANAGFDFFFLDMEHGTYDLETAADIIKAARLAGIVPFVRVPDAFYDRIARVLDAGAMGIMAPRVETRETVERVVEAVRYPPAGKRGLSIGKGNSDYRGASLREFVTHANQNNMVILQIERKEAVEHIDELLAVPGVDLALIGPFDLTLSLGADDIHDEAVARAIERVVASAERHGVVSGIHVRDIAMIERWNKRGMRFLTYSTDLNFVIDGAESAVSQLRSIAGR